MYLCMNKIFPRYTVIVESEQTIVNIAESVGRDSNISREEKRRSNEPRSNYISPWRDGEPRTREIQKTGSRLSLLSADHRHRRLALPTWRQNAPLKVLGDASARLEVWFIARSRYGADRLARCLISNPGDRLSLRSILKLVRGWAARPADFRLTIVNHLSKW